MNSFLSIIFSVIGIILAIILMCLWMCKYKENHEGYILTFTRDGLTEQSEKIKAILEKMNTTDANSYKALLLLEEITMRMHEHTDQAITAHHRRRWGKTSILLTAYGPEYNPIAELSAAAESEDEIRNKIFAVNKKSLAYKRTSGKNTVQVYV